MRQTASTKSIRLSPAEAAELSHLSELRAVSEAALMKKWVQEGLQAEKLTIAIQAYMEDKTDIRGGAAMAGISYHRFMDELQQHKVVILEDDQFLDSLMFLADAFDRPDLEAAVTDLKARNRQVG